MYNYKHMNKSYVSLIFLILLAGVVWYWWPTQSSPPAVITITTPTGGEIWQPGEDHIIVWETHSVSTRNKVSITIRRIPPPALQEEGQEFDPILFTNLPNTGSVHWKISSMYPNGTYVLGIHAYESTPITNEVSAESKQFTISRPQLLNDIYPLYLDADWQTPVVESFLIGTTTYSGASIISAPIYVGMNPGGVFTAFEQYYNKKLKSLGWQVDNDFAAGGHVGGQIGYRKGSNIILTRFQINYQSKLENAPSECPCDVTLSLFSTVR